MFGGNARHTHVKNRMMKLTGSHKSSIHVCFVAALLIFTSLGLNCDCRKSNPIIPPPTDKDSTLSVFEPVWSPDGRSILLFGRINQRIDYDLYRVDSSGGLIRLLNRDSLGKIRPTVSPNGMLLAYLAADATKLFSAAHIWVMNIDGTSAHDLTTVGGNWKHFRWSPDSRYILAEAPVSDSGVTNYQVIRLEVSTKKLLYLTRGKYDSYNASYFYDGSKIIFNSGRQIAFNGGGRVWIMNPDGSNPVPLDTSQHGSSSPVPSPVDNRIVFDWGLGLESDAGVYMANLDSITLPANPSTYRFLGVAVGSPQWSPNGQRILFSAGNEGGVKDLYVLQLATGEVTRLTEGFQVFASTCAWSPTSQDIVFQAQDTSMTLRSIFVYHLESNSLKKLTLQLK